MLCMFVLLVDVFMCLTLCILFVCPSARTEPGRVGVVAGEGVVERPVPRQHLA